MGYSLRGLPQKYVNKLTQVESYHPPFVLLSGSPNLRLQDFS